MSSIEQRKNKRIAKNTLLLYFRMLLTMVVSLYTSRVVLRVLGVEDYGIYNVVGGVVSMFAVLSGSLSAAISRFLTFELGRDNNQDKLKAIFASSVTIQIFLSLIVIVIAESLGLWFLNCKMTIPAMRMFAANCVLQLSVVTFCINLISVPYNAAIVAHERMSAFAYVSIFEAVGKLAVAFAIYWASADKLIFYALLMCLIAVVVRVLYGWYCKKNFDECEFKFSFDKTILKQMFSFAGWNFIGASSSVLRDHGGNIVINLFCGPTVNAARGIAVQVNQAVYQFASNFMVALNPQITKSYASGNKEYMMSLIFQGARLSFYMLMVLSLPILLNTEYIMRVWLGNFPDYTVNFVQLTLVFALCESISNPLITAMLATGNIRNYQIIVGGLQMMNLPMSYIFLKRGFPPETILFVAIALSQCCLFARLVLLRGMIGLNAKAYLKKVYLNIFCVFIVSVAVPCLIKHFFVYYETFVHVFIISIVSFVSCGCVILFVGCSGYERQLVYSKMKTLKNKVLSK